MSLTLINGYLPSSPVLPIPHLHVPFLTCRNVRSLIYGSPVLTFPSPGELVLRTKVVFLTWLRPSTHSHPLNPCTPPVQPSTYVSPPRPPLHHTRAKYPFTPIYVQFFTLYPFPSLPYTSTAVPPPLLPSLMSSFALPFPFPSFHLPLPLLLFLHPPSHPFHFLQPRET